MWYSSFVFHTTRNIVVTITTLFETQHGAISIQQIKGNYKNVIKKKKKKKRSKNIKLQQFPDVCVFVYAWLSILPRVTTSQVL